MTSFFSEYKKPVVSAFVFFWTLLSLSYAYAAFTSLTSVSTGQTLSKDAWNTMVSNLDDLSFRSVPSWAVMSFNLGSCPSGWSTFASANGRVVIWVGSDNQGNSYSLLNAGWEARHSLSISEMPSHNHAVTASDVHNTGVFVINDRGWDWIVSSDNFNPAYIETRYNRYFTDASGGSQAHENRMPYVALLYCVKN